jgi:cysteine desulfurase
MEITRREDIGADLKACGAGEAKPSHVLTAIGLHQTDARAMLRISVARPATRDQIDDAAKQLIEAISCHLSG